MLWHHPELENLVWKMLGNQISQTAMDALRHTFSRCIQHSESENHKDHVMFIQYPQGWWCCGTILSWRTLVGKVGQPNGPNSIGCTQAHLCKMHPTLREWKSQRSCYVHSVPTRVMMLWHHPELENFGGKSWATKCPKQHWMHPGPPLQDASNTQRVKNSKVILCS